MIEYRASLSFPRFQIGSDGSVIGPSGRSLSLFKNKQGYQRVTIYLGDRRWRQVSVHTLVCEAFHGAKPEGAALVAHRDGNPANNQADNLRWATFLENEEDKRRHGRALTGERHHQAKLTAQQVRAIRDAREAGVSLRVLAESYGLGLSQVSRIAHGKAWAHLWR